MELAYDLLLSQHPELRRSAALLTSNMSLHGENKHDIATSPLLPQLLLALKAVPHRSMRQRKAGEDTDLALALAALCADQSLLPILAHPDTTEAFLSILNSARSSKEACRHAAWAASSLATHRPVERSLLSTTCINVLCAFADNDDRSTRRDAMRAVCWLCMDAPHTLPRGSPERMALLSVVVRCGMATDAVLQVRVLTEGANTTIDSLCASQPCLFTCLAILSSRRPLISIIQELALLSLGLWSEDLSLHAEIVYAGGLGPLVLALKAPWTAPHPVPKAHLHAARALANIAIHATYRPLIVDAGGIVPLIKLVGSAHPTVRLCACRVICSISSDASGALAILQVGMRAPRPEPLLLPPPTPRTPWIAF